MYMYIDYNSTTQSLDEQSKEETSVSVFSVATTL